MSLAELLVFSVAYALAVASPGPGVAAVVAQVLGQGVRAAPAYIAGILTGDLLWFAAAATGLAALAHTFAGIFIVIKWLGVAYLLFLAWKMWTSEVIPMDDRAASAGVAHSQLFASGLMLTLGNPKTIGFFLALLPVIVDLETMSIASFAEVALLIVLILPAVLMIYAFFAHVSRRFFKSPRAVRRLNRISGAAIAGAAATIAIRS